MGQRKAKWLQKLNNSQEPKRAFSSPLALRKGWDPLYLQQSKHQNIFVKLLGEVLLPCTSKRVIFDALIIFIRFYIDSKIDILRLFCSICRLFCDIKYVLFGLRNWHFFPKLIHNSLDWTTFVGCFGRLQLVMEHAVRTYSTLRHEHG